MLPNQRPPIEYATTADLRELQLVIELSIAKQHSELKSDLHKTIITAMLGNLAMFGTLVTVLKLFT